MVSKTLYFILLLGSFQLSAQDAYHNALNTKLQTEYGLPGVTQWVLPNTEAATWSNAISYGAVVTNLTPAGQLFAQARQFVVAQGGNPWDAGHFYPNQAAVSSGDKCLFVMWLRSDTPGAEVNFFVEDAASYDKEAIAVIKLTNAWKLYAIPFAASGNFAQNALHFGLHLAYLNQTVEVGGAACLNYKNTLQLSQLPVELNNDTYPGMEPDALWRAEAAASIEQIRKANLTVMVRDLDGNPLPNAHVNFEMQQHEFKFGTAVVGAMFNGGNNQNDTYEQKLINLDGLGHGFNEVVFENDLKWPAWEQHWGGSATHLVSDVQWLHNQGISIRGHNLVWPGWGNMPSDMSANQNNPTYLRNRIRNHLNDILQYPGVGTEMEDWDVLNEITANTGLASALAGTPGYISGREIYKEIYQQADSLTPNSVLYLNDYVAIEHGDVSDTGMADWKSKIDELLNAGAPVEGIGFQGHFSTAPTGIPRVKEIYDDFWANYGLESKVTEYDISPFVPAQVQAQYLRDIMTISFAHPSMKGFLMWGFWDGAHWLGNAPIYNQDWSLKPSGAAYIDQVFHQWWTNITTVTPTSGDVTMRGFRGKYRLRVACGNAIQEQDIVLDGDKTVTVSLHCTLRTREEIAPSDLSTTVLSRENALLVNWTDTGLQTRTMLRVFDVLGQEIAIQVLDKGISTHRFDTAGWPAGVYFVQLENGGRRSVATVIQ